MSIKKFSAISLITLLFFACSGNKKSKLIVGDWKIADMAATTPKNIPDSLKSQYDEMFKKQVEAIKASSTPLTTKKMVPIPIISPGKPVQVPGNLMMMVLNLS